MQKLLVSKKSPIKTIAILTLVFAIVSCLTSCANNLQNLARYEKELRAKQTLNGYLALEYLQYSRQLAYQNDRRNSNYFALKGLKASKNQEVFAEAIENWPKNWQRNLDVNNNQIEQANFARQRLVGLFFDQRVRQILPIQLAHLQLLYDCWMSTNDEQDLASNIAPCKILFFRLEDEINRYLEAIKPKKEIKIIPIVAPQFTRFDIYFDLGLNTFNNKSDKTFVQLFGHLATLNGDYQILLVGNADQVGKKLYNDVLARNRSLAVKERLIKNGIPEDLITIQKLLLHQIAKTKIIAGLGSTSLKAKMIFLSSHYH